MGKMTEMMAELLGVDQQQIKERERQREEASLGKKAADGLSSGVDRWNNLLQRMMANDMSNDRNREKKDDEDQRRRGVETTTTESRGAESSGKGAVREGAGRREQTEGSPMPTQLDRLLTADAVEEAEEAESGRDRGPEL